jgi:hypothetical protein
LYASSNAITATSDGAGSVIVLPDAGGVRTWMYSFDASAEVVATNPFGTADSFAVFGVTHDVDGRVFLIDSASTAIDAPSVVMASSRPGSQIDGAFPAYGPIAHAVPPPFEFVPACSTV